MVFLLLLAVNALGMLIAVVGGMSVSETQLVVRSLVARRSNSRTRFSPFGGESRYERSL